MSWQRKEYRPGRIQLKLETPLFTVLVTQADAGWLVCMGEYVDMVAWTRSEETIKRHVVELLIARCTDTVQNARVLLRT